MFEARQSREVGRLSGPEKRRLAAASVGVLLSKSLHLSGEVYQAMRARGFRGEVRTLDDFRMSGRDWVAAALCATLVVGAVWSGR
ncbi:MAG TPA: energy-coupling factor transporter transmembrane component T, partial [Pyrinomonadaceae bacterium]|nr:energy-coupling factor transporter transmembrane component T [Pyrinomonadaceae bacterium]